MKITESMTTTDIIAPPSPSSLSWTAGSTSNMTYESVNEVQVPAEPTTTTTPRRAPAQPPTPTRTITQGARPISTITTSTFRLTGLNLRFSGDKAHPVHPRHFLKEFNIAMRDLGVTGDREKISAFEDYLVVDSPAEMWYGMESYRLLEATWRVFQDEFLGRFPGGRFDVNEVELQKIKSVKFRQNAAVSAYILVKWIDDSENSSEVQENLNPNTIDGTILDSPAGDPISPGGSGNTSTSIKSVKLGGYKPIATEEIFVLSDYGVPEGSKVQFSSHVWGVGEYTSEEDIWFIHDSQSPKGADFRQSGTAFKGWFNHTGKYEV